MMGTSERHDSRQTRGCSFDSYKAQARATDDVVEWQTALRGQLQEMFTAALFTPSLAIIWLVA